MYRFWPVIKPILDCIQPEVLLEIGIGAGAQTKRLVEYCKRHGLILHCVDPDPQCDMDEILGDCGDKIVFHRNKSLAVLSALPCPDVVLIDGDHNWFTVFNELKGLHQLASAQGRPMPLVFLHDVCWPYGERDMYYSPEAIPHSYRHPHKQRGLRPGQDELQSIGGINSQLHNAESAQYENNGVRGAVESFVAEYDLFEFRVFPVFHGLGVITNSTNRHALEPVADLFQPDHVSQHYFRQMEAERLQLMDKLCAQRAEFKIVVDLLRKQTTRPSD